MLEYKEKHKRQTVYLLSGERRKKDHFTPADGYNSLLCKCIV